MKTGGTHPSKAPDVQRASWIELERKLGYTFKDKELLKTALTHRSFRFENKGTRSDNQRLEFLGDSALGLVAADYVFRRFRSQQEGALSIGRSQMTSGKTLARVGAGMGLGRYLLMGKGEESSGGRRRDSTLADALESLIGAAYLDGGLKAVERIFAGIFRPVTRKLGDDLKAFNPKGRLQEYCQRVWKRNPEYRVANQEGPPHAKVFVVRVHVCGKVCGTGRGAAKQEAESAAAAEALRSIERDGPGAGDQDDDMAEV